MKIKNIEYKSHTYHVTFTPNLIEKLFGVKEKTVKYLNTGNTFTYGGGSVFLREDGTKLRNGNWVAEAIDKFRNKF